MKYAISNFDIVLILPNGVRTVGPSHKFYTDICLALQTGKTDEEVMRLVDAKGAIAASVNWLMSGEVVVQEGQKPADDPDILVDGMRITGRVADLIKSFRSRGIPVNAFRNFWKRVQSNPLLVGRESMITFLEHNDVPLLPDGRFLAYKGVNKTLDPNTFVSTYDCSFVYRIGEYAEKNRTECTIDVENACGPGLHVGSFDHASSFGDTLLDCIVDPADVTSVPQSEAKKLRACRVLPIRVNNAKAPYEGEYINLRTGTIVNAGKTVWVPHNDPPPKEGTSSTPSRGGRNKKTTWYKLVGTSIVRQRKVLKPGPEWTDVRPEQPTGGGQGAAGPKAPAVVSLRGAAVARTWYRRRPDGGIDRVRAVTKPNGYSSHKPR